MFGIITIDRIKLLSRIRFLMPHLLLLKSVIQEVVIKSLVGNILLSVIRMVLSLFSNYANHCILLKKIKMIL
jgi:hypothetical protein